MAYRSIDAFPRRPIAVRMQIGDKLSLVLGALVFAGSLAFGVWLIADNIPNILNERTIFETGTQTKGDASATCASSKLGIKRCVFEVDYVGAVGQRKSGELTMLLWGDPERDQRVVIRFDPENDSRFAISWGVERWLNRAITASVLALVTLGLGGLIGAAIRLTLRDWLLLRKLAANPDPVPARIIHVKRVTYPSYAQEYTFEWEGLEGSATATQRFPIIRSHQRDSSTWQYSEPLFISPSRTMALGLRGPRSAVLVEGSLNALLLGEEEKSRVLQEARHDCLEEAESKER